MQPPIGSCNLSRRQARQTRGVVGFYIPQLGTNKMKKQLVILKTKMDYLRAQLVFKHYANYPNIVCYHPELCNAITS